MKQFIKNKTVTYNLMSFTGYKALIIFSLLLEGPKSYEEVCDYIIKNPYLKGDKISIDTLRVYINSFKKLGCKVLRSKGADKISRYQIISHPFELSLNEEERQSIIKVFKTISKNLSLDEFLELENFLEKIAGYIKNEEFALDVRNSSMLKNIDKDLVENLLDCCKKKKQIIINYHSPNSGKKDIELIADKLEISNGKIYLCGTGFEYNQYASFLLSRIKHIVDVKDETVYPSNIKELKVVYELDYEPVLQPNDRILEKRDNKFVIETTTSNDFFLQQKLLEYGPACKILEPESFRDNFIALLKDMKAGYYCG